MSIDRVVGVVGASVRRRGRRVPRLAFLGRSLRHGSPLFPKSRKRLLRRFLQGELGLCAQLFSSSRAPAPISSGPDLSLTFPKKVEEQVALFGSGINHSNHCLAAHLEMPGSMGIEKSV